MSDTQPPKAAPAKKPSTAKRPAKSRATRNNPLPTKPKTRVRASKYNWAQVQEHYIAAESQVTLTELADIYNIPVGVVRNKSSEERWTYLRASHQAQHAVAVREARSAALSKKSVTFDDNSLKAAELGQTLILGRLGQIAQVFQAEGRNFNEALEMIRSGQPVDKLALRSSINYKELVELANALDRFQTVGRRALGTDQEAANIAAGVTINGEVSVNVHDEMMKPDLDRMAGTIEAMRRAGLESLFGKQLPATIEGTFVETHDTAEGEVEGSDPEVEVQEGTGEADAG